MANLQMVDLRSQYHRIKDEIDQAVLSTIDSTAYIKGPVVGSFEKHLAEYNQIKNAVTCGNGTDALQIAMMALDLSPGDEVILPVFTYVATAEVIALLRLKPVFVDVDEETFNISIQQIEDKITEKTKAIVPVHLFGQCADMEALLRLSKKYGLYIIEDAAQAIGSQYSFCDGNIAKAGTIGDIGCLSFFPSKNLGCFGDGGALLINDIELAERARMIANHGQRVKYKHDIIGCNSRLDTIQAAVLDVKLKYLNDYIESRARVAEIYDRSFSENDFIITPYRSEYSTHVFHQYTLRLQGINRAIFRQRLQEIGVPTMIYYPIPLHFQEAYRSDEYSKGSFPIAESLCEQVISIPIHTEMDDSQIDYILSSIHQTIREIS